MNRKHLALLILLSLIFPVALQAQFSYTTNANGTSITITGYTGTSTTVSIPTDISGLTVTAIGTNSFDGLAVTSVTIPNTVTSIGSNAFLHCTALTNVSIANSVSSIGETAFGFCALTAVTIPNSLTTLGNAAFRANGLTNVALPVGLTNIGEAPFFQCSNLAAITVAEGNPAYSTVDGVLFAQGLGAVIQYPCAMGGSYSIPNNVTNVDIYAFSFCPNLESVTIPATVTSIGIDAFFNCPSLTNVCFEGNSSSNFNIDAFEGDALTNIFYVAGTTGWGATYDGVPTNLPTAIPMTRCTECGSVDLGGTGSIEVSISPTNVVSAGAEWEVDGGLPQQNGVTVSNLSVGSHTVSFTPVFGWHTPAAATVTVASNAVTLVTGLYTIGTSGSLQVVLLPAVAVADGVQWQLDGGSNQNSGAILTDLAAGAHTISFTSYAGWNTPPNQTVTITGGVTTMASGIYTAVTPPSGVTLLTNGDGAIQHSAWPSVLVTNKTYKVTAVPARNNIFTGWVGGTNQPFGLLSSLASYTFTNEPNLVLEANFVTNVFLASEGSYRGLFAPVDSQRLQTNSGSFTLDVASTGAASGSLNLGGQMLPFSGKFNLGGLADITVKMPHAAPSLALTLQLDFADQSVSGTISNTGFSAELNGFLNVFNNSNKATDFVGQYTFVIPGVSEPSAGPFGNSYGTVKVSSAGAITMAGSLADGTAISQSSVVSQDGYWPLYLNLYGGKGSLWGWTYIGADSITAAPSLSWINETNSSRTAVYRSGFTNQDVSMLGSVYLSSQTLPAGLTSTLLELNQSAFTNKLTLKTNLATGVITGSFPNPGNSRQSIQVEGVILQGQTNAEGYFLGTNQSGAFSLDPP